MVSLSKRDFLTAAAGLGAAMIAPEALAKENKQTSADSVFNVKAFGAKGDGVTSDTKAIQAALDAAGKVSGTVWVPAGTYLCHDLKVPEHVTIKSDPAWIFAPDTKGAVLKLDDENASCLLNVTRSYGARIYGLTLQGIPQTPKPVHGIYINNSEGFSPKEDSLVVDNVKVQYFSGNGIYLKRAWLFLIRHSQCYRNGMCGVMLHGWDGFICDNQFSLNGMHGFGTDKVSAAVMFTGNRLEWNKGHGLKLCEWATWNVTGNSFDRNHGAGIYACRLNASTFTGNTFNRNGRDPSTVKGGGAESCQIYLEGCRGVTCTGNTGFAGRDDGGGGDLTPRVAIVAKKMQCSIVKDNAFAMGFTEKLYEDLGGHGADYIYKDNVGYPAKG